MQTIYNGNSKKSGVYQIRNLIDGKVYVGSAKEFKSRFTQHRTSLRKGIHHNKHLQAAFIKYGEYNFIFEVLEVIDGDRSVYTKVEQLYINKYLDCWEACYNFDKKSISSNRGPSSEDTKRKQSLANSGKNNPMYGKKGELAPAFGRKHTEEAKWKISAAKKGKSVPGRPHTEETKAKLREAHLGKSLSADHKKKLSEAHKGIKPSKETIAKRSEALRRSWASKNPLDWDAIVVQYELGAGVVALASKHGCSAERLSAGLRARGLTVLSAAEIGAKSSLSLDKAQEKLDVVAPHIRLVEYRPGRNKSRFFDTKRGVEFSYHFHPLLNGFRKSPDMVPRS